MNTISAFALTFIQLALVLAAMYLQRVDFTDIMLVYGSPVYLAVNIEELNPHFYTKSLSRLYLFTFQIFKYFFLVRAFTKEPKNFRRTAALLMEVIYLAISCTYIFPMIK